MYDLVIYTVARVFKLKNQRRKKIYFEQKIFLATAMVETYRYIALYTSIEVYILQFSIYEQFKYMISACRQVERNVK